MSTTTLEDIAGKLAEGQSLAESDAEALASTYDIVSLGMLADDVRRSRHGTRTTFLRVAHVDASAAGRGEVTWPAAAREVRLDGPFEAIAAACGAVRRIAASAAGAAVSAFSLAELERAAGGDASRVHGWIGELYEAGLGLVAEAPLDAIERPAALLRAVEDAGVSVARLTVQGSSREGVLSLIRRVAAVQAESGAVRAFAPIPRQPGPDPTTGYEDVKAIALARLLLPDVPHIQVDWSLHGPKLAQVSLTFGADDLDNVSAAAEVAEGRRRAPLEEVRRNIRAAGFEAVERDARFAVLG